MVAVAVERARDRDPAGALLGEAREGDAVSVLLQASEGADLLVVGQRGLGPFAGGLLGSVAHQCVRHARGTVAVVRPEPVEADPAGGDPAFPAALATGASR